VLNPDLLPLRRFFDDDNNDGNDSNSTANSDPDWVQDTAVITGVLLLVILVIMVICSLPFVRRNGYFQVHKILTSNNVNNICTLLGVLLDSPLICSILYFTNTTWKTFLEVVSGTWGHIYTRENYEVQMGETCKVWQNVHF